jgi:peptidoglycan/LPS O-acetylase OafA/YrhL
VIAAGCAQTPLQCGRRMVTRIQNTTRIPELDLLRFIAAAAVVLYHYVTCFPVPAQVEGTFVETMSALTRYGYMGVDLFFMISGFVILWSSIDRDPVGFAISRISRLYPAFWVSLAITSLCVFLIAEGVPHVVVPLLDHWTLAANATMIPATLNAPLIEGVYWTLEIEIRFYALVMAVLLFRQMHRIESVLYSWLAISVAGMFVDMPWIVRFIFIEPYAPFFVAGCFFYLVLSRGRTWPRIGALAVAAISGMFVAHSQREGFITPDPISAVVVPALVLLFFGIFVALTFRKRVPAGERFARLGSITYPLYLVHGLIGYLIYEFLHPHVGVGSALLIITAVIITLSWLITVLVDIPARKPFAAFLYRVAAGLRLVKRPAVEDAKA